MEQYCRQAHHLYLADFGAGRVKVGTASAPRRRARPLEQGPVAASIVATGDGPAIKRLEKLAALLGMTERMQRRLKATTVFTPGAATRSRSRIDAAYDSLRQGISGDAALLLHDPEPVDLPDAYIYDLDAPLRHEVPAAGRTVAGTVLATRGSFVLLDSGGNGVALDLAGLKGHVVDVTPMSAAPLAPAQLSLL